MQLVITIIISTIIAILVSVTCILVYDQLDQKRQKDAPFELLKKDVKKVASDFERDGVGSFPIAIVVHDHFIFMLDTKLEKSIIYGDAFAITENIMIADVEKGKLPEVITNANLSIKEILEKLDKDGEVWLSYQVNNQEISKGESGKIYLFKGKSHIFGGGPVTP